NILMTLMNSIITECGIVDIAVQLSHYYCDVKDIAKYFNIDEGKLTVGLGLEEASACALNEDAVTLGLSAIKKLMERNNLKPKDIGRLEVGTESNWDGSKSFKTYLMSLFETNKNISGCDTTNACYGGTNALLNAMYWVESSFWDGKYAIVVCTDTCFYDDKNLIPLAGSAACALLIGKNPVFKFYTGLIEHCFSNTYDFSKPRHSYPYPFLDGKMSVEIYKNSFNHLFDSLKNKSMTENSFDHICLHTPYPKLPVKICKENNISSDKLEKSILFSKKVGNPYTASLYLSLYSLIYCADIKVGENVLMFSFGSGAASSMFLIKKVRSGIFTEDIFKDRKQVDAATFVHLLNSEMRSVLSESTLKHKKGFVIKSYNEAGKIYELLE
ncbi:hydroxymethylglutaryl-CoA synthase, partial [Anncaliia algerae PRA109]